MPARSPRVSSPSPARIVVVGAGGNIGSHLVPHLARMDGVGQVVLVDRGKYESSNLGAQDITPREVGHPKAAVQGRRLLAINPALDVRPLARAVEDVPLGCLQADVLLACLDSRAARQYVNQAAWHLGMPWIDAGVHADGLLARVSAYRPAQESPCMECAWDERDYAVLEQAYPCGGGAEPPPTGGPSSLGALAAALQALECQKLLGGATERVLFGSQVVIDASTHKHYVTTFRRNPACRMREHEPWTIARVSYPLEKMSVDGVLALRSRLHTTGVQVTLSVAGRKFVTRLSCPACGATRPVLRLAGERSPTPERCAACAMPMVVAGFDLRHRLPLDELSSRAGSRSLRRLGLRQGDVFTLEDDRERLHFVLDGRAPSVATGTRRRTG